MVVGALALLLTGGTAAAQTQETNTVTSNSVGNPQLRDFELPGTRVIPPARPPEATVPPVTIPAPAAPPPPLANPETESRGPDPQAGIPAPRRTPRAAAPRASSPPVGPDRRLQAPAPAQAPAVAAATAPPQSAGEAPPAPAPPAESPPQPVPAATAAGRDIPWLYVGLAALAALVALLVFLKVRRRPEVEEEPQYLREAAGATVEPGPETAAASLPAPNAAASASNAAEPPQAVAGNFIGIQLRPWIELEFKPVRAAATPTEANVQFELAVRNTGTAPARNVRIEVRMFNAGHGQEQEIEAFYGEPIRERTPPALEALPAKGEVQLTSAVAMPNENVRELTVQGRRLFIPTVAFNVVYDWGNGKSGQTSASYLVGREAETPAEKMGAFRLDLGPRLYRSVGQRPMRLARTV